MSKRLFGKGLWIWTALSAVIIIAGIVVGCLFGFNHINAGYKAVEIEYDSVIFIEEKEDELAKTCESVFTGKDLKFTGKATDDELDTNYIAETGNHMLRYTFDKSVSDDALKDAATAIKEQAKSLGDVKVSYHTLAGERFYEASWRAAIALGVAAVVALVYVGFRFGWDSALAGLVAIINDTCVSLAIIVLTRIPVYAYAPVLYAGIALVLSAVLWLLQCMKMRENFKDPSYAAYSAEEAVVSSVRSGAGFLLAAIIPLVWLFVIFGVVAAPGMRMFMIYALIPLAVSVYSSFLLAPAVYVPFKSKFDRIRSNQKRYVGKKKTEAQ